MANNGMGRMPGRMAMRQGSGGKLSKKTAKRLFVCIAGQNPFLFGLVIICILLSTAANVAGSLFLKILIGKC